MVKKYNAVLACKAEIMGAEKRLVASSGFKEYVELKRALNSCMTKFYRSVEELENTGIVIKNIDQGLLDFPAKRFDQEIWLCWKAGEDQIKFWHEKDAGFDGRKPIAVSDESLV